MNQDEARFQILLREHLLETCELVILHLVLLCGGQVTLDAEELRRQAQQYTLDKAASGSKLYLRLRTRDERDKNNE